MFYRKYLKRPLDVAVSLVVLPFILIICLPFSVCIYLEDRGPVIYKAKRRGRGGQIFYMYKLRSMKVNAPDIRNKDNSTFNSKNDPRVTKVGKILRRTSIDETLQVLNVLKGEMSWIGPRASVPKDGVSYEDLGPLQKKRLEVLPGITGYTAALYRNSISKEEKYKSDCYYVDHLSFLLDMKTIFWSVKTVLLQKNINTN